MPAVSVLLTTYDRPQALACTLEGYRRQTYGDFEIVLGDDGSGEETRAVVERYQTLLPVPLVHVWSEHQDHGRTRVINATARAASGDYFIFSDADCVPETDFIERHTVARRPGAFLNGRRLMMARESLELTPDDVAAGRHRSFDVADSRRDIAMRERKALFYRALGKMFCGLRWDRLRLLGANFSMWRADFEAINGFDEGYVGWGAADEDFRRRLQRIGLRWRSVMSDAHVWHIAHPPVASKPGKVKEGRNAARYDRWVYLTQPLLGVHRREPADLGIRVSSDRDYGVRRRLLPRAVPTSSGEAVLRGEVVVLFPGSFAKAQRTIRLGARPRRRLAAPASLEDAPVTALWGARDHLFGTETAILVALRDAESEGMKADLARWGAPAGLAETLLAARAGAASEAWHALDAPQPGEDTDGYLARHRETLCGLVASVLS